MFNNLAFIIYELLRWVNTSSSDELESLVMYEQTKLFFRQAEPVGAHLKLTRIYIVLSGRYAHQLNVLTALNLIFIC